MKTTVSILCALLVPCVQAASLKPGEPVDFTPLAMQPDSWKKAGLSLQLTPWVGKEIVFLTTDASLDQALMAQWVEKLDAGWALYRELTGLSPGAHRMLQNKPTIAAVPSGDLTCGAGCGYVGATGIELAMFYDQNYPELRKNAKHIPHYVFYEMGRNFYTFGKRHSSFTTGFAVFMRYVCMDTLACEDIEPELRKTIEGVETRFKDSGLSFLELFTNSTSRGEKADRIRDASGKHISPSDQPVTYAAAMLRLQRENGGNDWVRSFFKHLATCPELDDKTEAGALGQCYSWFVAASLAAGKDLTPVFCDQWHLPMSEAQRATCRKLDWAGKTLDCPAVLRKLGLDSVQK